MDERIIKYFAEELNQTERLELLREIENDEELKKEFASYRNTKGLVSLISHPDDRKEGEISFAQFMRVGKVKRRESSFIRMLRYAAAITLIIAGSWTAAYYYYDYQSYRDIQYNTVTVPAGQQASITLSDGTQVWMNARSSLRYPSRFNRKERKAELKGEAYFTVTRNEECPFIVSTSALDVKVLGTTFNVKANEEEPFTDVSLLKGSVEVILPGTHSSQRVHLKPMQSLNYSNGQAKITQLKDENNFLWQKGILFFDKLPLSEIAKKVEWYYDTQIIISNPETGKHQYSGKFRQQDGPYEILRILQKGGRFKLEKDDVNNIFMIK